MTEYFIAKNVANMMTEPDSSSALDSQTIAGTLVTIEKKENGYCFVKTPDLYHGWVSQLRLADVWDISQYKKVYIKALFANIYPKPDEKTYPLTRLVISTCLPIGNESANGSYIEIILPDKQKGYVKKDRVEFCDQSDMNETILQQQWKNCKITEREQVIAQLGEKIAEKARQLIGTPYLWGGCTPFGIDCSGLTQLVYRLNGIQLPRNSYMQCDDKRFVKVESDKELDNASLNPGDLLLFDTKNADRKKINHTGIACGDGTFVQADGQSREGAVILSRCSNLFFKQRFMGAARLSSKADINIVASN